MTRRPQRRWFLIAGLTSWVCGLFFVPGSAWLKPFAFGDLEVLSPGVRVAGAGERPGRAGLARVDLGEAECRLLTIQAPAGDSFTVQVKDDVTGRVLELFRLPARDRPIDLMLALDSREFMGRLRLTVWNRSHSELLIGRVAMRPLHRFYRWAPRVYWLLGPLVLLLVVVRNRRGLSVYLEGQEAAGQETWPQWDGTAVALLFLFCFTVFRVAPVHQLLDSKFISVVSHSLITQGVLSLPEDFARNQRARKIYTLRPVGEKTYHFFSSAPAILNAPIVAIFESLGVTPVGDKGEFLGHNERQILRFIAALLAAALCVVLFLTARVWLPPAHALVLVLVFAFGSQIFSTLSRPFWSHTWSTLLLAGALYLLVDARFRDRHSAYLWMSTLLCWAYFCRPPMSLAILGVTLYMIAERRRFLFGFLATGLVWAGLFVLYATQTYGSLLPPYFLSSHVRSGRLAGGLLLTSYPEAIFGTLISPGRGLFVYVPILVLVFVVVIRRWQWLPDRTLALTGLGVCLLHWQLVSVFRNWWGGQSFGPRLMSDLVPWFFLLAALGWAALRTAHRSGKFRWTPANSTLVALLVLASLFINARGALDQETQRGAGIWNWRYPQFLAGLIPRPDEVEVYPDRSE